MINIFFNPNYFLQSQKKLLLTRSFKYSLFYDMYVRYKYNLKKPINEKFIYSGPHYRMNNLLKLKRVDNKISFNQHHYQNYYFVQFDSFSHKILETIKNDKKNKILIGPLFDIEYNHKLNREIRNHSNIKKLVASKSALNTIAYLDKFDESIKNKTVVFPSGVVSEEEITSKKEYPKKTLKCLIYFKKRNHNELNLVIKKLIEKNIDYKVFSYGHYTNSDLTKYMKASSFAIILGRTESQGFAIQKIMSYNIPILVWDYNINFVNGDTVRGTSVPYWSSECGEIFSDKIYLESSLDKIIANLENYEPKEFIKKNLTNEIFYKNIVNVFKKF